MIVDNWGGESVLHVSRRPSPIVARGDEVAFVTEDAMLWWDARTMKRVDKTDVAYRAVCMLQDGSIVAYSGSELHHFDRVRNLTELGGEITRMEGFPVVHLLQGRAPTELYLAMDRTLERYRLDTRAVERLDTHTLHDEVDDQMIALGDGRFMETDEVGVRIVAADAGIRDLAMPGRDPLHVALAGDGRIWVSYLTARFSSVVALASLETPQSPIREVMFGGRMVHLSAAEGGLAVLVMLVGQDKVSWRLHLLDTRGDERWWAEVVPGPAWPAWTLNYAFVALTDHRVVLAVEDHLLAWDAATGTPILLAEGAT